MLFLEEAKKVAPKWKDLLDVGQPLSPEDRLTTAIMLENQELFNEVSTDTSDVANFKRISIPLVRRIFPQLIANKIVGVQPLLGPVGLVYYLRFRYATNKGAIRGASNNAGFPTDDANSLQQLASGDTNLQTKYSSTFVDSETTSTDDGADVSAVYSPLEHTPIIAGSVVGSIYDGTTLVQTFTISEAGSATLTDVGSPAVKVTALALNNTTGELTATWNSAPGSNYMVVSYEYNMECNPDIPEINLAVENEEVVAITRKLKAVWSLESQQDIRSQHNLSLQEEMTSVLAQEINLEIDREIIEDLRNYAGTVSTWDYKTALGLNIKEKYESLYVRLHEVSAVIHRKTMRGAANFVVTSPEVASIFETATAGFAPAPSETFTSSLGVQYVGTVNKKYAMYKDPNFPKNQILLGFKGPSYMDSGYFYMPYIPLSLTPVLYDPDSFCPRFGIITRYGKKLLREGSKFYGRISVANFAIA